MSDIYTAPGSQSALKEKGAANEMTEAMSASRLQTQCHVTETTDWNSCMEFIIFVGECLSPVPFVSLVFIYIIQANLMLSFSGSEY